MLIVDVVTGIYFTLQCKALSRLHYLHLMFYINYSISSHKFCYLTSWLLDCLLQHIHHMGSFLELKQESRSGLFLPFLISFNLYWDLIDVHIDEPVTIIILFESDLKQNIDTQTWSFNSCLVYHFVS